MNSFLKASYGDSTGDPPSQERMIMVAMISHIKIWEVEDGEGLLDEERGRM